MWEKGGGESDKWLKRGGLRGKEVGKRGGKGGKSFEINMLECCAIPMQHGIGKIKKESAKIPLIYKALQSRKLVRSNTRTCSIQQVVRGNVASCSYVHTMLSLEASRNDAGVVGVVMASGPPEHVQVFQDGARSILRQPKLNGTQWLVLWCCLCFCDYAGEVDLSHRQIAIETGVSEANISRVMAHLAKLGYLIREKNPRGNRWRYFLPATLIHKGSMERIGWKQYRDMKRLQAQRIENIGATAQSTPPQA